MNVRTVAPIIAVTFLSHFAFAQNLSSLAEEEIYNSIVNQVLRSQIKIDQILNLECDKTQEACLTKTEVQIQALNDLTTDGDKGVREQVQRYAIALAQNPLDIGDALQVYAVYRNSGGAQNKTWEQDLKLKIIVANSLSAMSGKPMYTLSAYPKIFSGFAPGLQNFEMKTESIDPHSVAELTKFEPNLDQYHSGAYKNHPRVFMFCRENREYPCLMVMKNANGKIETLADGVTPWSQPSIGYSRHKKSYNNPSGNTPSGILRIDGVMPDPDQQLVFGKFRRLVLNFVASTKDETDQKILLPPSSHTLSWWKEAVVARDMGRGLLRIHGTGLRNYDSHSRYYPFVGTSGCIAKRENTYGKFTYTDQRHFLDELMHASNLDVNPDNEYKIKALLYVINVNNEARPVTLDDLKKIGAL